MKSKSLKRRFINEIYNSDYKRYLRDRKKDYCAVQYLWECWRDALYKDGEILQRQYNNTVF